MQKKRLEEKILGDIADTKTRILARAANLSLGIYDVQGINEHLTSIIQETKKHVKEQVESTFKKKATSIYNSLVNNYFDTMLKRAKSELGTTHLSWDYQGYIGTPDDLLNYFSENKMPMSTLEFGMEVTLSEPNDSQQMTRKPLILGDIVLVDNKRKQLKIVYQENLDNNPWTNTWEHEISACTNDEFDSYEGDTISYETMREEGFSFHTNRQLSIMSVFSPQKAAETTFFQTLFRGESKVLESYLEQTEHTKQNDKIYVLHRQLGNSTPFAITISTTDAQSINFGRTQYKQEYKVALVPQ